MRLSTTLLISFSLSACGVPKPDTDICGVNSEANHKLCYNLKKDYDNNGNRKPDAKPKVVEIQSLHDLNKNICTDPDGFENLLAYIKEMREKLKDCRNEIKQKR